MKRPSSTLNKILFAIFFLLITSTFMSCATNRSRTYHRYVPSTQRNRCGCYIINEQNENIQQITLQKINNKSVETRFIAKQ
jgi:hypothetical protein